MTKVTLAQLQSEWPEPQELARPQQSARYPIEAFPPMIQDAIKEVAEAVQAPIALVGSCALSAISVAAQSKINVSRDKGLDGPVSLYLLSVAMSGDRKSSIDGYFMRPIETFEREIREARKGELLSYRARLDSWEAERKGILKSIQAASGSGKDTAQLKQRLIDLECQQPEQPKIPQLMVGECTSEGLKKHLAEKYPSAVIHSAEAGEIFGGHAMRADTALATLANYNKLWSGERIQTSRSSVVSHIIEEARLTVSLQIQKESLDDFLNKTGQLARGSGFLARFLLSMPESLQGTRLYRPMPEQMPKLEAFHKRLEQILDVEDKFDGERLQPNMMALSPEAHSIWQQFYNQVERELAPNGDLREIADTASKIGDNAARIAALFQYFVDGGDYVQAEHMKGGALIAAWHLHEAQRFFGEMAAPADVENAIMLENWLVERAKESGSNSILFSKARQSGPNRLRRKEAMNEALQELIEAGRAKLSLDRPKQIQVNPALVEVQP